MNWLRKASIDGMKRRVLPYAQIQLKPLHIQLNWKAEDVGSPDPSTKHKMVDAVASRSNSGAADDSNCPYLGGHIMIVMVPLRDLNLLF